MGNFQVGYASVNINPMLGIGLMGYYIPRYASGFLDDLEASALALSLDSQTVLLISVDTCLIETDLCNRYLIIIEQTPALQRRIFFCQPPTLIPRLF